MPMGEELGDYDYPMDRMDTFEGVYEHIYWNDCIPYEAAFTKTIIDNKTFQIVMGAFYSFIWLFGTISNALVLLVLLNEARKSRPWVSNRRVSSISSSASSLATSAFFSVRFIFVASLALADLLTNLTSLPVTSISIFTRYWIFPSFMCHVIGLFQGFSIFQSSFTFTSIAIDRYLLIFYPNRSVMTKRKAALGLISTAALSLLLSAPMALFVSVWDTPQFEEDVFLCGRYCIEQWPKDSYFWDPRVYGSIVLVLQFGLPVTVTSFCYSMVAARLRRMSQRRRSGYVNQNFDTRRQSASSGFLSATSTNGASASSTGKRLRANRMMLAMVVAFVLSWSPHNLLNIMRDFGVIDRFHGTDIFPALYAVAHLLAMTTLIWNPIIYAWFNPSIREALKVIVCWRWRRRY